MEAGLEPYELAGLVRKSVIDERMNANLVQISRWQVHAGLAFMGSVMPNEPLIEPAPDHHSGPPEYRP